MYIYYKFLYQKSWTLRPVVLCPFIYKQVEQNYLFS